jgi:hypothetical protein
MNHLGKDLKKASVILKEKYYNGSESVRTFKCESGSGCAPDSIGNEIRGAMKSEALLQTVRRAESKAMRLKRLKSLIEEMLWKK